VLEANAGHRPFVVQPHIDDHLEVHLHILVGFEGKGLASEAVPVEGHGLPCLEVDGHAAGLVHVDRELLAQPDEAAIHLPLHDGEHRMWDDAIQLCRLGILKKSTSISVKTFLK
jgi:hypothetical protein